MSANENNGKSEIEGIIDILAKKMKSANYKETERVISIECVNTDDGWKIDMNKIGNDIFNVLTGNFLYFVMGY